jgi:hypothetical protein
MIEQANRATNKQTVTRGIDLNKFDGYLCQAHIAGVISKLSTGDGC